MDLMGEVIVGGCIFIAGLLIVIYEKFISIKHKKEINESLKYLSSKRDRRPAYEPDRIAFERFQREYTTATLSAMARDILKHVGMTNSSIPVYPTTEIYDGSAGRYVCGTEGNFIEVRILQDTKTNEVLATLIHECMHYYLRTSGIRFDDTIWNEILTDTATIYFGFGEIINRGYVRVGYIKDAEISYIKRKLKKEEKQRNVVEFKR